MPTFERLPPSLSGPSPAAEPRAPLTPVARSAVDAPSPFSVVLRQLSRRIEGGEALIDRATKTDLGPLDAPALIAVQAGIYRYVEAVDLAAKLVDRASNAIRTVLQGNH